MNTPQILILVIAALWFLGSCLFREHMAYSDDGFEDPEWFDISFSIRAASYVLWPFVVLFILYCNFRDRNEDKQDD